MVKEGGLCGEGVSPAIGAVRHVQRPLDSVRGDDQPHGFPLQASYQKPIPSPFINIGINYMNQAVRLWNEIFQIVKENCSTDYGEISPQDDLMERLLRARKGVKPCLRK